MNRKKNLIIVSMMAAVLLMIVGYAAFATRLSIGATSNITTQWEIEITGITSSAIGKAYNIESPSYTGATAKFNAGFVKPGDKMQYTVTVKNKGTAPAIIDEVKLQATGNSVIIYSTEGIQGQTRLAAGTETSFKVIVEFDRNATFIPSDASKRLTMTIVVTQDNGQSLTPVDPDIENVNPTLVSQILNTYTAKVDTGIDFSNISSKTNGEGLFYTTTNTENNEKTYYFRGNIENNYVKFGTYSQDYVVYRGHYSASNMENFKDYETMEECENASSHNYGCFKHIQAKAGEDIYWRIVRINEDESIRLIYQGTSADASDLSASIGNRDFDANSGDNTNMGYMYGIRGSSDYNYTHSNMYDTAIKIALDRWYEETLKTEYSKYIADSGFCNDRSIASSAGTWNTSDTALGYGTNNTYYGAYNRLTNLKKPQFACPNASNDLFTTTTSIKGNKKLTNPVGLITVDEVVYAGAAKDVANTTYYMNIGDNFWTGSPSAFVTSNSQSQIYRVDVDNTLGGRNTAGPRGVRPVINLVADVRISSGNGTNDNPYVIDVN